MDQQMQDQAMDMAQALEESVQDLRQHLLSGNERGVQEAISGADVHLCALKLVAFGGPEHEAPHREGGDRDGQD